MEQKMCPVCGKIEDNGNLLLDKRLRPQFDMKTTTGYDLCKEHKEKYDEGYLALVVCDESKSQINGNNLKMEDAYRTGEIIHMKIDVFKKMFNKVKIESPMIFINTELAKKLKIMVNK